MEVKRFVGGDKKFTKRSKENKIRRKTGSRKWQKEEEYDKEVWDEMEDEEVAPDEGGDDKERVMKRKMKWKTERTIRMSYSGRWGGSGR